MTEAQNQENQYWLRVLYELLDLFVVHRDIFENWSDEEYQATIDDILDQINLAKKHSKSNEQESK